MENITFGSIYDDRLKDAKKLLFKVLPKLKDNSYDIKGYKFSSVTEVRDDGVTICAYTMVDNYGDKYIVVNNKSEAYKLITDRNKYPDNYVKWDIIHTFTLGLNGKDQRFKGWIIDFERTNTTIKYKVEIQEEGKSTKDTYYTVAAPFETDYNPFTLKENQVSVAEYKHLYSDYLCQLNVFPGVDINYLKSVFYKLPHLDDE